VGEADLIHLSQDSNKWWAVVKTVMNTCLLFVFLALQPIVVVFLQPGSGLLTSSFSRFLDHTQRRATVGRTRLDN
jgi:hypothetical protein